MDCGRKKYLPAHFILNSSNCHQVLAVVTGRMALPFLFFTVALEWYFEIGLVLPGSSFTVFRFAPNLTRIFPTIALQRWGSVP
jgi:hypothetical protein